MRKSIIEKAYDEVSGYMKTKDRRTRLWKHEFALAKQEFFAEVEAVASKWFDERNSKMSNAKTD